MLKRSFILLWIIILTGCGGGTSYQGISGAKPKAEPLSKSGNPSTYKALGKKYSIMHSSKGYKEKGQASWYGKDFHGKRTSSGTPYNMHHYSAAHKTLPIPTYVLVTNLENKKQLVVRVDDRGPFARGRIIDLSYKAAKDLGMIGKGTARVMVEALPPYQSLSNSKAVATTPSSVIPTTNRPSQSPILISSSKGKTALDLLSSKQNPAAGYALQFGAFSNQLNAHNFAKEMSDNENHPIRVYYDGNMYRVLTGNFHSKNLAQTASDTFRQVGLTNTIYQIR